jgi:DNA-binding NarL/FixJ family response regulator
MTDLGPDDPRLDGWNARTIRHGLAPRQMELMRLLATGLPIKAIAPRMGLTYYSAKHVSAEAFRRLGVSGKVEAFIALGWLEVPE